MKLGHAILILSIILLVFYSCEDDYPFSDELKYVADTVLISPVSLSLEIDSSHQFTTIVQNKFGEPLDSYRIIWELYPNTSAEIDSLGVLTARYPGELIVRARAGNKRSNLSTINMYEPVLSVAIDSDSLRLNRSTSDTLRAIALDENGNALEGVNFHWYSMDTDVVEFTQDGVITAVGVGETSISVGVRQIRSNPLHVAVAPIPPIVWTTSINDLSPRTVHVGCEIIDLGGDYMTENGVCWNTEGNPTLSDSREERSGGRVGYTHFWVVSGLIPETTYYVRAFGTSSAGIGYGEERTFTTPAFDMGSVTDVDGNTYETIRIGNQWWMTENLKALRYQNGDSILSGLFNPEWQNTTVGAVCAYQDDEDIPPSDGRLYNWYAVQDDRNIAPTGWHVATDNDWKMLELHHHMDNTYVNGWGARYSSTGIYLKSHEGWGSGAGWNSSNFSARPSGYRQSDGSYEDRWYKAFFWTNSIDTITNQPIHRLLQLEEPSIERNRSEDYFSGMSVRCVLDD